MPVAQGDVVRVSVEGLIDESEDLVSVWQFRLATTSIADDTDVLDDIEEIVAAVLAVARAAWTSIAEFTRFRAFNLTTETLLGERTLATAVPGTASGEISSNQVTVVSSFKTNVPRVTLRKFWGPMSEGIVTSLGYVNASVLSTLASGTAFLLAPIPATNGTWDYGYFSPKTGSFVVPLSALHSAIPATQRRRRRGVGS